jgi:ATP-dependent exoDNAse (exonuclease V) alpha subunit
MLASRRTDVRDLNRQARERLDADGTFSGPALEIRGQRYQAGDRIICGRNARRIGVTNGTTATIHSIDLRARAMTVVTDQRHVVTLPAAYLDAGHVSHGYATTIHSAQGTTVDRAFVLADDRLDRETGYTALSRGRLENRIYTVAPINEHDHGHTTGRDPVYELRRHLSRTTAQDLATGYRRSPAREQTVGLDVGVEL